MAFPRLPDHSAAEPARHRMVYFQDVRTPVVAPVYARGALGAGSVIDGPALIQEHGTTTVLFAADRCTVAPSGELVVTVGGA
jgi:N-methylhydantoinase A